jgi:HK97 gp10 family phage protein
MAAEFVRIEGLEPVVRALNAIEPGLVGKNGGPVLAALKKAAKIIQAKAKANVRAIVLAPNKDGAPSRSTGFLEKAIVIKRGKKPIGGKGESVRVTVRRGGKRTYANNAKNRRSGRAGKGYELPSAAFYGWFLERGTEKMAPHPWMLPAFESTKQEALITFVREMEIALPKIVADAARAAGARS